MAKGLISWPLLSNEEGHMTLHCRARAITAVALTALAGIASAATTSTLLYSTDGGTTWSSSVSVNPGQIVLVREWYNNPDPAAYASESLTTTLPAGFALVANTTRVCVSPLTTDPLAPNNGQDVCANQTDSPVWAGSSLSVSPTSGLYGQTVATSGIMNLGQKAYLNLHQCMYQYTTTVLGSPDQDLYATAVNDFPAGSTQFNAGTNASNAADSSAACGAGDASYAPLASQTSFQAVSLVGNRYLNLNECTYARNQANPLYEEFQTLINGQQDANFRASTHASNTADASAICTGGDATYQPSSNGTQALDLLGNRYFNLNQCAYRYTATAPFTGHQDTAANWPKNGSPNPPFSTGTNTSNTPDAAPVCGAGNGTYGPLSGSTANQAIDLYDGARGAGFVQFSMTVPTPVSTTAYPQNASVTGPSTSSSSGTVTVTVVVAVADVAHSGVAVTTNNAVANGTATDVLSAYIADASGNPLANQVVTFTQPAGVTLSSPMCATNAAGTCQVTATSTTAASYSSTVTVGGAALSGSVTVGGAVYGPSPASYVFAANGPVLPTCTASPNPASASQQVTITCTGGLLGNTVTISGTNCAPATVPASGTVVCAGLGSNVGSNPTVTVSDPVSGTHTVSVALTVTSSGSGSVSVPVLGPWMLVLFSVLIAAQSMLIAFRQQRR